MGYWTSFPFVNFVLFVVNLTSALLTTKDTEDTKVLDCKPSFPFVNFVLFVVNLSHQNSSI